MTYLARNTDRRRSEVMASTSSINSDYDNINLAISSESETSPCKRLYSRKHRDNKRRPGDKERDCTTSEDELETPKKYKLSALNGCVRRLVKTTASRSQAYRKRRKEDQCGDLSTPSFSDDNTACLALDSPASTSLYHEDELPAAVDTSDLIGLHEASPIEDELEDQHDSIINDLSSLQELGIDCSGDSSKSESSESESTSSPDLSLSDDEEDESTDIFMVKLYSGAKLSIGASCILITQFSRKYKLPRKAQNDLLTLIKLHFPEGVQNNLPKTYGGLLKRVIPSLAKVEKIKVCRTCSKGVEDNAAECPNGHLQIQGKPTKDDSFFVQIPLEPQLQILFEDNVTEILETCGRQVRNCQSQSDVYRDITDGSLYKQLLMNIHSNSKLENSYHITLMMSTDGASVYKSIHCSMWPLYACVLELPINRRYSIKNVLLLGLWYGPKKPDINVFLERPFNEINKLQMQGLQCLTRFNNAYVTLFIHLHCFIADLPGKALVLNHKLYNGKFGCMTCYHPGLRLAVRGNVRIYPYKGDDKYQIRKVVEIRQHALLAELSGCDVYGIKGFSMLHNYMSVPDGCPVDYMHCILQGTGKWIIQAIFNSKNKGSRGSFYIGPGAQKVINAKLKTIAVPHDMNRKPRSLEYIKYWKATEIQHFLLYFGLPLLKGYLSDDYFHHLALLTTALWIFLKNEISVEELTFAGELIKSFCRLMEPLYGERSQTINAHSLTHLEQQVKCLGPLWTHSAFAFEAMIAHTLTGFKGTRGAVDQMVTSYQIDKEIHPLQRQLIQSEDDEEVKQSSTSLALSKPRSIYNGIYIYSHNDNDVITLTLDERGNKVFEVFVDKIATTLNKQWAENRSDEDVSKDDRHVLRLAAVMHVFFDQLEKKLKQEPSSPPRTVITAHTLEKAIALSEYFAEQRKILDQLGNVSGDSRQSSTEAKNSMAMGVLACSGPFATVRLVQSTFSGRSRPVAAAILEVMAWGKFKQQTTVFYKCLPYAAKDEALNSYRIDRDVYLEKFSERASRSQISKELFNKLVNRAENKDELARVYLITPEN